MPLAETLLTTIAEKVFNYALDQGQNKVADWAREKFGLEPKQQAFKRAVSKAYKKFEKQYPQWASDLFNASFLEREGMPILAQFLLRDGHPDPSDLAARWADSLNIRSSENRTPPVRELEPAASDFLDYFARALKAEPALSDLNDSRAFEELTRDLNAIRRRLGAEQATPGTQRDYLRWLIERNLYLDARGTFQTQRQVQVKLDEVYISLRAQRDKIPNDMDLVLDTDQSLELRELLEDTGDKGLSEIVDQYNRMLHRGAIVSRKSPDVLLALNILAPREDEILELAEAVDHYDRLAILGDPGSGKTTLLSYLALKHAQALWEGRTEAEGNLGRTRFPILIRTADYAEHGLPKGQSLSEFLVDYHALHECPKEGLADLLASELAKGQCLILLDGLDEIVSTDKRSVVVNQIEDFVRRHYQANNRFVITSRIAGYKSAPLKEPFACYIVREMDQTQIRRFLERWCRAVEAAQTPDLSRKVREIVAQREIDAIMKAVQTSPGVRRLAANPLLLRTLALIHRTGAQLPQKRIELYKLAADLLTRTWRTAQGVPETALVEERYVTRLLGRLAYWMHIHKSTGLATEWEVYRELGQEWALVKGLTWDEDHPDIEIEVKKFLRAVSEHTGIFVERAPKHYGFLHLTFEEYYAARYLVARSRDRVKLIRQHLHHSRWEEPILLALGFVGLDSYEDATDLFKTAILVEDENAGVLGSTSSPYEEILGRDYLFALRCLGDSIPVHPRDMQRLVHRLANELLHRTGPACFELYRQALEERLEHLSESEAASELLPLLISASSERNDAVRREAAWSLGVLGQASPQVMAPLLNMLNDPNPWVRFDAASSLGRLGKATSEVITALINTLYNDVDSALRQAAARILDRLGETSPVVIKSLIHALHHAPDPLVRQAVAWNLGRLASTSSQMIVAALIQAFHNERNVEVRRSVTLSLGRLTQVSPMVVPILINALQNDPSSEVRNAVALSLRRREQVAADVLMALINALKQENDANVRQAEVRCLGRLGRGFPQVVPALTNALQNDRDPEVRRLAAESLGELQENSAEVISALMDALHHAADSGVRRAAVRSLGEIGRISCEVIPTLIDASSHHPDASVKRTAIECLGLLEQPQASEEVITILFGILRDKVSTHNKVSEIHRTAAKSLIQLGQISPEIIAIQLEGLRRARNRSVRRQSAQMLGLIGQSDELTVQALCQGLFDPDNNVRAGCSQALVQMGKRFPTHAEEIKQRLKQIIEDRASEVPASGAKRSSREYAFEALWKLEIEGTNQEG